MVSSAVEHPAITKCLDHLAAEGRLEVTYVGVDGEGRVSAEEVVEAFRPETALVTVMHSNNEVNRGVTAVWVRRRYGLLCAATGHVFL